MIDVRENRGGQLSGFAKYPDIAFFLDRLLGITYAHEPLLAPSPEIRDAYRNTRDWQQYEASFCELMAQRKILEVIDPARFEGKVALLCSEPGPEKCHRRLLAEMLTKHWSALGHDCKVIHLAIQRPAPVRKRRVKVRV